jgi:type VII secretion integral membrane protein EccD
MTGVQTAEQCRVTVFGPAGRADLVVPVSTTVAQLTPMLVRHVVDPADRTHDQGSWVLQRLGEAPLDPDGTPETLDWLEGERLYLNPAKNPLPELDFDDVADGMATAVNRQANHWRPEHARYLFLSLAVATAATVFAVLGQIGSTTAATITASSLALVLAAASVSAGRWTRDSTLAALPGIGACCFAAAAGLIGVGGSGHVFEPEWAALVVGALCAAGTAGLLLGAKFAVAEHVPLVPFGTVAVCGVAVMISVWLHVGVELTKPQTASIVAGALFIVMIYSPKIAIRAARIRGPQLPRTADELQVDIEPEPAKEIITRTGFADQYFTVITMSGSSVYVASFPYLLDIPGWVGVALPALFTVAVLLRARNFAGMWQRLAVSSAGSAGIVYVVLAQTEGSSASFQIVVITLLLLGITPLVMAATRPPERRLLPIWGHIGNVLETATALALLPLLLQVLGVYAWARGLAG